MTTSEKMEYAKSRAELITAQVADQTERVARAVRDMAREFDTSEKIESKTSWMLSACKDIEGSIQRLRELEAKKEELNLMIELMEQ